MLPDAELAKKTEDAERARLEAARAALGDAEVCACVCVALVFFGPRRNGRPCVAGGGRAAEISALKTPLLNNRARAPSPIRHTNQQHPNHQHQRIKRQNNNQSNKQLERVIAETAALKERQETPDSPEALACVPALKLEDIPRAAPKVRSWGCVCCVCRGCLFLYCCRCVLLRAVF